MVNKRHPGGKDVSNFDECANYRQNFAQAATMVTATMAEHTIAQLQLKDADSMLANIKIAYVKCLDHMCGTMTHSNAM